MKKKTLVKSKSNDKFETLSPEEHSIIFFFQVPLRNDTNLNLPTLLPSCYLLRPGRLEQGANTLTSA